MRYWTCCPPDPTWCRSGRLSTSPDASADGFLRGNRSALGLSTIRSIDTRSTGTWYRQWPRRSAHLTRVDRPDILLLACLFHDIGKLPGAGVHHAARGAPIAREAVETIGLNHSDAELVEHLVRHHLTLAGLATKRDHADPATVGRPGRGCARPCGHPRAAALSHRGRRSRGRPGRLVTVASSTDQQPGRPTPKGCWSMKEPGWTSPSWLTSVWLVRCSWTGRPRIRVETQPGGVQLVIAATDRLGLFSDTAGLLASHSVQVRSAVLHTVEGVAVNTWRVDKQLASRPPRHGVPGQTADTPRGG